MTQSIIAYEINGMTCNNNHFILVLCCINKPLQFIQDTDKVIMQKIKQHMSSVLYLHFFYIHFNILQTTGALFNSSNEHYIN